MLIRPGPVSSPDVVRANGRTMALRPPHTHTHTRTHQTHHPPCASRPCRTHNATRSPARRRKVRLRHGPDPDVSMCPRVACVTNNQPTSQPTPPPPPRAPYLSTHASASLPRVLCARVPPRPVVSCAAVLGARVRIGPLVLLEAPP
jgi:hypothetical protein